MPARPCSACRALRAKLLPFLAWRKHVTAQSLRDDLGAALVGALLVLPQGIAFATLAGVPPEYGLYGAMLPAVVGALWGSSRHRGRRASSGR